MAHKRNFREEQICKVPTAALRTVGPMHFSPFPEKCRNLYCLKANQKASCFLWVCRSDRLFLFYRPRGPPPLGFQKIQGKRCLQMKNYWASDYALNRKSAGIVYRFADGVVEVTLEDYIRENPDKTEADFLALKAISDEIYQQQFSRTKAQSRRELPLYDCAKVSAPSAEEMLEGELKLRELETVHAQLERFIGTGLLTEIQRRRFSLYCINGLSTRQIAGAEGVTQKAVWKSLHYCEKKFKNFLGNRVVTPLNCR